MSDISSVSSMILENILNQSRSSKTAVSAEEKLQNIKAQMEKMPSVLDSSTLQKLRNGEYDISLKEYTNLNSYKNAMKALYGDNSANPFQNYVNKILEEDDDKIANAKKFIDKMKENGMSSSKATKLYSALKTYSIISSFRKYNFVDAKI